MAPRGAWTTSLAGKWEQTTTPLTTVPLPLLFEVQIEYHILLQEIIQLAQAPTFGYRSYVSEYSTVSLARTCKKNSIAIIRILHSFYTHDCASQRIFIPASKTSKTRLTDLDISPKRKGFTCKNIMEKTSIAIIRIFHSCSLDSSLDIYLQSAKVTDLDI